jgi:hypothetical protein
LQDLIGALQFAILPLQLLQLLMVSGVSAWRDHRLGHVLLVCLYGSERLSDYLKFDQGSRDDVTDWKSKPLSKSLGWVAACLPRFGLEPAMLFRHRTTVKHKRSVAQSESQQVTRRTPLIGVAQASGKISA